MAVMAYQPNINQEMHVLKIVNHHHFFATIFSPNPLPVKEKITGKWQKGEAGHKICRACKKQGSLGNPRKVFVNFRLVK